MFKRPGVALILVNTLAAVSWIAYDRLQPVLLQVLEVSGDAVLLDLMRSVVMVFVPLIAGWLGGDLVRRTGTLLPLVITGVVLAAMVFFSLALDLQWVLVPPDAVPVLIFLWLLAMNLFIGPANSMLSGFTGRSGLTSAVTVSLMVADLLYAMEQVIGDLLYAIGLMPVFAGAAAALLVAAVFFRGAFSIAAVEEEDQPEVRKSRIGIVLLAGLATGLMLVTVQEYLPIWVLAKAGTLIPAEGKGHVVAMVLLMAAGISLPAARFIGRAGERKGFIFGLTGMLLSLAFTFVVPDGAAAIAGMLACGGFLGLLTVSVFPFAMSCLSPDRVPFGTGLLFSAVALPEALVRWV